MCAVRRRVLQGRLRVHEMRRGQCPHLLCSGFFCRWISRFRDHLQVRYQVASAKVYLQLTVDRFELFPDFGTFQEHSKTPLPSL